MKIKSVINYLESIAPSAYQEKYDNAGLIVGNSNEEVKGILVCLDSVEAVVEEAIEKGCNLIVAHHPIIFGGLKRLNGKNYVERTVIKAIKNDIAIYAIHTNLDNVTGGVNSKIAEKIGLINTKILAPKSNFKKLYTFVPAQHIDEVRNALFEAGAGQVNDTSDLSYSTLGVGTESGTGMAEMKLEVLYSFDKEGAVINALMSTHPSELPAFDIVEVQQKNKVVGSGMIGDLKRPMSEKKFLKMLKENMSVGCVKYTKLLGKEIKKVAVCGGAGGFLLRQAIGAGADVFVTSDYKYHEFFDADGKVIIADIGHYESEQFTIELLSNLLSNKFSTFAVLKTTVNTNPVFYL